MNLEENHSPFRNRLPAFVLAATHFLIQGPACYLDYFGRRPPHLYSFPLNHLAEIPAGIVGFPVISLIYDTFGNQTADFIMPFGTMIPGMIVFAVLLLINSALWGLLFQMLLCGIAAVRRRGESGPLRRIS